MFTGIIQSMGTVLSRAGSATEARFVIRPHAPLVSPAKGESIAVNGTCLTAESFSGDAFTAYASGETFSRTTLRDFSAGRTVNLEQALRFDSRLGGHLVSGHVDCVTSVLSVTPSGDSVRCRLSFPAEFGYLIIPKGSVALDGISLTVNECGPDFLEVNVIPETRAVTTVRNWRAGTLVNLETDLIGKYVARMLHARQEEARPAPSGLNMNFLREHGF